jgi:putative transposase
MQRSRVTEAQIIQILKLQDARMATAEVPEVRREPWERLKTRRRGGLKRALGTRRPMLLPDATNIRWSHDFESDAPTGGCRFVFWPWSQIAVGHALALVADTLLSGHRVALELDAVIARRGRPAMVVSGNRTEPTRWPCFPGASAQLLIGATSRKELPCAEPSQPLLNRWRSPAPRGKLQRPAPR